MELVECEVQAVQLGFRLSWPGHDAVASRQTHRPGRLLDLLPLGLSAFMASQGCRGWPVRLAAGESSGP